MSRNIWKAPLFFLLLLLLLMAPVYVACVGGKIVVIKDFRFDPDSVTIKAGEMVTWKNEDRRDHQIMSGAPPVMTDMFASPVLRKGESWSYTFEEPGEYPYHSMTGSFTGVVNVEQ